MLKHYAPESRAWLLTALFAGARAYSCVRRRAEKNKIGSCKDHWQSWLQVRQTAEPSRHRGAGRKLGCFASQRPICRVASAIVLSSGASFHLVYDFHFSICMFEVWCTGRSERARCYYHVVICSGTLMQGTPHTSCMVVSTARSRRHMSLFFVLLLSCSIGFPA